MLLLIDNYDSFTYNLVHYFHELGVEVLCKRNDAITPTEIKTLAPSHIVISPGPGTPTDAGVSNAILSTFKTSTPILGVCLGHQCIAEHFGATLKTATPIMHGKTSVIEHSGTGLFENLPETFSVTRYHSLLVDRQSLPKELRAHAWVKDEPEKLMALTHQSLPLFGVQFHPEAVLTQHGHALLKQFLCCSN